MKIVRACLKAACVLGLCSTAFASGPHLNSSDIGVLRSGNVSVFYLDPETPLGVYLRTNSRIDMPPNGGAIGGGGSALVAGIIDSHRVNEFVEAIQPYAAIIDQQHLSDQGYALSQDALRPIPWMQKAEWQRLPAGTDRRRLLTMMKGMRTQAAIVLIPETQIRNDLNQVWVDLRVEIYVKDPYEDYGVKRLRSSELTSLWPEQPKGEFPPLDYINGDSDAATDSNLKAFFADGGAHLAQDVAGALPGLKSQFIYLFTGVMPPVPATAAAPAAATRQAPAAHT